jgi:hypothetical protein
MVRPGMQPQMGPRIFGGNKIWEIACFESTKYGTSDHLNREVVVDDIAGGMCSSHSNMRDLLKQTLI